MNSQNLIRVVAAIYGLVFGALIMIGIQRNDDQQKQINFILDNQTEHAKLISNLAEAIKTDGENSLGISFVLDEHGIYIKSLQDQINAVQTSNNTNVSFGDQVDFMIEQGKIMLIRPYNPK